MKPTRVSAPTPGTHPRRIYVAFTPYHLLLCLAIQDRDGNPDATIFFADEARLLAYAPEIGTVTRRLADLQIVATLEGHPAWQYPARCRLLARHVYHAVRSLGVAQIYLANGVRPESQRLFREFRDLVSFRFIEDGLDSYIGSNRADVTRWRRSFHRALCGSPHPSTGDMVEVFAYETYNVIAPELSRTPSGQSELIPISSVRRTIEKLWPALPIRRPSRAISDLYLLANSERMASPASYLQNAHTWLQHRQRDDPQTYVAIKAHPRERDARFLSELGELGDYIVPHWVPAEFLAETLGPESRIHCGLTTFILTSRLLAPKRRLLLDESVHPRHADILQQWDSTIEFDDFVSLVPPPISGIHNGPSR